MVLRIDHAGFQRGVKLGHRQLHGVRAKGREHVIERARVVDAHVHPGQIGGRADGAAVVAHLAIAVFGIAQNGQPMFGEARGNRGTHVAVERGIGHFAFGEHEGQFKDARLRHKAGEVVQAHQNDVDDPRTRAIDHGGVIAKLALGENLHGDRAIGARGDLFGKEHGHRVLHIRFGHGMGKAQRLRLSGKARQCQGRGKAKGLEMFHSRFLPLEFTHPGCGRGR